ncbi:hypothetical protein AAOGI_41270 [Agarivorans albus]
MKKLYLLGWLSACFFSGAHADEILEGKVTNLRTFPEAHSLSEVRQHVVFRLDQPLLLGCTWLYLSHLDSNSISLLLSAKVAKLDVSVYYSNSPSPWHTATCKATEVSLK